LFQRLRFVDSFGLPTGDCLTSIGKTTGNLKFLGTGPNFNRDANQLR
jgi:hypothetical protein